MIAASPDRPDSRAPEIPPASPLRRPAAVALLPFAAGILLDRVWSPSFLSACGISAACLIASIIASRRRTPRMLTSLLLGAALLGLGAARHHLQWTLRAPDDIAQFVGAEETLVRVRARLTSAPEVRERPPTPFDTPWRDTAVTSARLRCLELNGGQPVSGAALLYVPGAWTDARAGDEIEVLARASRPAPPRNPGEFDFRNWLRRQRIDVVLRTKLPLHVRRTRQGGFSIPAALSNLRADLARRLRGELSADNAAIAEALLLGIRTHLDDDLRRAFLRSGTIHLLAISGLHVGIAALLVQFVCRGLNLSSRTQFLATLLFLGGYAALTELRPSVFRATVFLTLYLMSQRSRRPVHPQQLLWITAGLLLVWNPTDLFDTGAQLSFLAVSGIAAVQPLIRRLHQPWTLLQRASQQIEQPRWRRVVSAAGWWCADGVLMGLGVWAFTLPLLLNSYRFLAPWSMLATLLLMPVVTLALAAGLLLLACLAICPVAAPPLALLLDGTLDSLRLVVDLFAAAPGATLAFSSPEPWWTIAYSASLVLIVRTVPAPRRSWLPCGFCLLLWGVGAASAPRPEGLRVTFLSVGHGCAILVEPPTGGVTLVDAGSHDGGRRAARAVEAVLRLRGVSRIERIVITHPDSDHYSAVPDLLKEFAIGEVVVTDRLLASDEPPIQALLQLLQERDIPVRSYAVGDALDRSTQWTAAVLHPSAAEDYSTDNAASLVLRIDYAGRSLLLTGDLERDGLAELLERPPRPVDVLLAPHHGSPSANVPGLANWARPRTVVVSGGEDANLDAVRTTYGTEASVYLTETSGAVGIVITPDGRLEIETHFPQPPPVAERKLAETAAISLAPGAAASRRRDRSPAY